MEGCLGCRGNIKKKEDNRKSEGKGSATIRGQFKTLN